MEFLANKRAQSRVDVYMTSLKDFCEKEIYDITDTDVLDFLVFKDVNDSGRTVVHNRACPFLGGESLEQCADPVKCAYRHSASSMRIGIVLKLRKAFEEVGRRGSRCIAQKCTCYIKSKNGYFNQMYDGIFME